MSRSKKIFLAIAFIFIVGVLIVSYDIAQRTTFPGSKSQLKERIKQEYGKSDSTVVEDTNALKD